MIPNASSRHLEFHVSRRSRDRYQFDQALFQLTGNVVFANFHAARVFAQRMNEKRDLISYPEQAVKAGQINAMGLIDEISHLLVENYRRQVNPDVIGQALQSLNARFGQEAVDKLLRQFSDEFPPVTVYRREQTLDDWFQGETNGVPHRELALEEMLMLWVANMNPAFAPFSELFDDQYLEKQTIYPQVFGYQLDKNFFQAGHHQADFAQAPALRYDGAGKWLPDVGVRRYFQVEAGVAITVHTQRFLDRFFLRVNRRG